MKGAKESLFRTLLQMVLVVLLLLVSFSILMPIVSGNIMEQITGNKSSDYVGIISKQRPFPLQWITPIFSSNPYQPSEVACEIAGKINSDFKTNGLGSRSVGNGANCEKEYCLVQNAVGRFDMSNTILSPPPNSDISNLNSRGCTLCQESSSGPIVQDLDEVCINDNLNSINTRLCNGPITVGGKVVTFGNSGCSAVSSTATSSWKNLCSVFCGNDGANDILPWSSEDTTSGSAYFISDSDNSVHMPGLFMTGGFNAGSWNNDNGRLLEKQFDYMYGILWDSLNSKYVLTFAQIPKVLTTDDSNDLFDIGAKLKSRIYRFNRLGTWYSEAREIEHLNFTPTSDITFQTFLTSLSDNNVFISKSKFCSSAEECTNTEPQPRGSQYCKKGAGYGTLWDDINGDEETPVTIMSNMGRDFIAGKTYDISVKNWVGAYFASYICYDNFDRTISIYEVPPAPSCGASGQACCSGNTCNSGLSCNSGVCQSTPTACASWTAAVCTPPAGCSALGGGFSCALNPFGCTGGACCCLPLCGQLGRPCCAGSSPCSGGLSCDIASGTCQLPCGASGQACCSGNTCNSGLSCNSGVCTASTCGSSGQPCCTTGSPCNLHLTCNSGTCQPACTCTGSCPVGYSLQCTPVGGQCCLPLAPLPGDVNGDGVVNTADMNICQAAFSSTSSNSNWNAACDLTGPAGTPDGTVDMRDIQFISNHCTNTRCT